MPQASMVTENDSPSVPRRNERPGLWQGVGAWWPRLGRWKAMAAGLGILLLVAALTVLPVSVHLGRESSSMRRMIAGATAEFAEECRSLHVWELLIGVVATLATSFVTWRYVQRRGLQSSAESKYLTGLEVLHRTILRVGSQMGEGREILTEMAEAGRRLLAMDSSVVLLLDSEQRVFLVHAVSGGFPDDTRTCFPVEQTPACLKAAQSGEVLFLGDIDAVAAEINVVLVRKMGARSVVVIPLRLDGEAAGVMVVADGKPRRFTDADRTLVEMLGAKTAMVLANSRLYDQARATAGVYQNLLLQQDALYEVAAAVYHASSFDESAKAIVDRAPSLLHVNGCSVQIREDAVTMRVAAASGEGAEAILGLRFSVAGTYAEPVLENKRMLVIEDARNADKPSKELWRARQAGSVVVLPLKRADRTVFGLLVMVRHCTGAFTEEQLRLFQVFADRAEAALENVLLQEQTRRDAATKTVLLRELHHRVNNNLAGIVALLSMNQPEMSDAAQRWIRRSIERIEAMARAHDLFTQGADRVRLSDLVARVPESIAVFQSAHVRIITDLDEEGISLATPRAVSLAMVLHELCSNALQHGVKDGGQVAIRSLRMDRRLSVQVCDDGVGFDPGNDGGAPTVGQRGGFGLQLVRELVGRELQGNMHIESAPGRGTTVSIAFPLERDEESQP